ncbi:MAG: hypothetical protein CM1200mP26_00510 [Acidimicrobiales bacterium]|nr:MAG: hypothetical protein CM1200mP26_00510 [Acidimicrobiales bacterium]
MPGCPMKAEIQQSVVGAVRALDGVDATDVEFTVMTESELADLRERLHGDPASTAGTNSTYGHSEGRAVPFAEANSSTRVMLVASGKGGVGKSSVTTNLAVALAGRGRDVAVVDADVWGFSIPRMLGVDQPPTVIDDMLIPPERHGVRCISMGFFAERTSRSSGGDRCCKGPRAVSDRRLLGRPRLPPVDLPPGPGDISISLAGFLQRPRCTW